MSKKLSVWSSADPLVMATRASPLALAQVVEIQSLLHQYVPDLQIEPLTIVSRGDRDLTTSLRDLGRDDFFTRELDLAVSNGFCHCALHAAKDLPEPLPPELTIVALTAGIDSGDCIVLPPGISFYDLPAGATIATSSARREAAVISLRDDLTFCDIRGTIHQRLAVLERGDIAGVVIAEAALIRLGLTYLNRLRLPGPTVSHQGRLAVVTRRDNVAMQKLFAPLHSALETPPYRRLHVGLTPPAKCDAHNLHCPLISTAPRTYATALPNEDLSTYTHYLFTSKTAVTYFKNLLTDQTYALDVLKNATAIAVGNATAALCYQLPFADVLVSPVATAEGVCTLLETLDTTSMRLIWPHSARARPVISSWLNSHNISWSDVVLYDTLTNEHIELVDLHTVDEVVFTSPSSVDAFCQRYGILPLYSHALTCCGPITSAYLKHQISSQLQCISSATNLQKNTIAGINISNPCTY
jgi:hydroxymethylbilane synthase